MQMSVYIFKHGGSNMVMQMLKHWCLLLLMLRNSSGIFFSWKSSCLIWSLWDAVLRKLISCSGVDSEFCFQEWDKLFYNLVVISSVRMGTQEDKCNHHDCVTGRWGRDKIRTFPRGTSCTNWSCSCQSHPSSICVFQLSLRNVNEQKQVKVLQKTMLSNKLIFEELFPPVCVLGLCFERLSVLPK